jgi:hypothetical protein
MPVQSRNDVTINRLFLSGDLAVEDSATLLTDAGRTTPLVNRTVMAKDPTLKKWVPLTDVAAVDGTDTPRGIFIGDDITAAALVAGDVLNQSIVVAGSVGTFDRDLIVLENSLTLDTEIVAGLKTIEDALRELGLVPESVEYVSQHENA